jgi:hypothetical protein
MKVLVIKNGSDLDIITESGSYAFSWTVDGVRKLDCYQDRISEKLDSDDNLNELLEASKCYGLEDMDIDTDIETIIVNAVDWLNPITTSPYECRIEELKDREPEDLINEFLKLK